MKLAARRWGATALYAALILVLALPWTADPWLKTVAGLVATVATFAFVRDMVTNVQTMAVFCMLVFGIVLNKHVAEATRQVGLVLSALVLLFARVARRGPSPRPR